jgi:hypothetical protein
MSEELDCSEFNIIFKEYYNRLDAQVDFEKRFFEKTSNKWSEKDYFKEKAGKFVVLNKEKRAKMMKEA